MRARNFLRNFLRQNLRARIPLFNTTPIVVVAVVDYGANWACRQWAE